MNIPYLFFTTKINIPRLPSGSVYARKTDIRSTPGAGPEFSSLVKACKNLKKVATILLFTGAFAATRAFAAPTYSFPVTGCKVNYAHTHHDYPATDILSDVGCKFISPINGTVDEVSRVDNWSGKKNLGVDRGGLFVSVIGEDGVRYYGAYLRSIPESIQPGVVIKAGQLLGKIGATGSARGTPPHFHFAILWPTPADTWWVRRGKVWPRKYLNAWRNRRDLSPAKAVKALKARMVEIPHVRS